MLTAYQEAVKIFRHLNPEEAAAKSGSKYNQKWQRFEINYFGELYYVEIDGRVWKPGEKYAEIPDNDRTLILQYLAGSPGLFPRGKWLSFLDLPEGEHHYLPFKTDATGPLARVLGDSPEMFAKAALSLGGSRVSMGDAAFCISAFPKIPLVAVIWKGDDEFAAASNILFDSVSPMYLTTAALWVLGVELARRMINFDNKKTGP